MSAPTSKLLQCLSHSLLLRLNVKVADICHIIYFNILEISPECSPVMLGLLGPIGWEQNTKMLGSAKILCLVRIFWLQLIYCLLCCFAYRAQNSCSKNRPDLLLKYKQKTVFCNMFYYSFSQLSTALSLQRVLMSSHVCQKFRQKMHFSISLNFEMPKNTKNAPRNCIQWLTTWLTLITCDKVIASLGALMRYHIPHILMSLWYGAD